jgi:hypothetical protein
MTFETKTQYTQLFKYLVFGHFLAFEVILPGGCPLNNWRRVATNKKLALGVLTSPLQNCMLLVGYVNYSHTLSLVNGVEGK